MSKKLIQTTTKFSAEEIKEAFAEVQNRAADKAPALVTISGTFKSSLLELYPGEVTIGRSSDNTVFLECDGVSRHHLKLCVSADMLEVTVEDLGSRNGTWLNNVRLQGVQVLRKGDLLSLGRTTFRFLPHADPDRLSYDLLRREANTDGLTRCFNKMYFNNALTIEMSRAKKNGSPLSLVIIDLDHFKRLNDHYGHDAGDYVLKEMAENLRTRGIRDQDIFSRYGGEEFVILLPNTQRDQAMLIAERFRLLIEEHSFVYDNKTIPVTASMGIAAYQPDVIDGTALFKRADLALYQAKEQGRNRVCVFTPSVESQQPAENS
ncbi:MAG: diguanylate cyclase [Magnetococcus sp. DMHC-6]